MAEQAKSKRFSDLREWLYENPDVSKTELALRLNIWPSKLTTLLRPDRYRVVISEDLERQIAGLLNQPVSHVRKIYRKAA